MYEFKQLKEENFKVFHDFMSDYYKDGEDSDTPQDEIDMFIKKLFSLIQEKIMYGVSAYLNDIFIGVVIWMKDTKEHEFSVIPEYGTIAEIGVIQSMRNRGVGCVLVDYAEREIIKLNIDKVYVIAYEEALSFWKKRGYKQSVQLKSKGLPVLIKKLSN